MKTPKRGTHMKKIKKSIHPDGGYLRFEGTATVEKTENGATVERVSDPAVWELMYFGRSCADEKYREKQK